MRSRRSELAPLAATHGFRTTKSTCATDQPAIRAIRPGTSWSARTLPRLGPHPPPRRASTSPEKLVQLPKEALESPQHGLIELWYEISLLPKKIAGRSVMVIRAAKDMFNPLDYPAFARHLRLG